MSGLLALTAMFGLMAAVLLFKLADARELRQSLVCISIRFPRDLEETGVQAFLGSISGLLPPWWRRWWHTPFVVSEVIADHTGTRHRLLVPRRFVRHVEASLEAHLPGVAYDRDEGFGYPPLDLGTEYRLTTAERGLSIDNAVHSAGLLSSLQPLRRDEVIVVQVLLAPARPVTPARVATPAERDRDLRPAASAPLLLATLRIGVRAPSRERGRALLRDAEATWHATRAPGALLKRRLVSQTTVANRVRSVWRPVNAWPALLNAAEAATVVGYPIGVSSLPGVCSAPAAHCPCRRPSPSPAPSSASAPTPGPVDQWVSTPSLVPTTAWSSVRPGRARASSWHISPNTMRLPDMPSWSSTRRMATSSTPSSNGCPSTGSRT